MSTQAKRVTAFQAAINAFDEMLKNPHVQKMSKKDLDLIRYALKSGFIKALVDNALSDAERREFDAAQRGECLRFFDEEKDAGYVYE
jgi:hypothetical protein